MIVASDKTFLETIFPIKSLGFIKGVIKQKTIRTSFNPNIFEFFQSERKYRPEFYIIYEGKKLFITFLVDVNEQTFENVMKKRIDLKTFISSRHNKGRELKNIRKDVDKLKEVFDKPEICWIPFPMMNMNENEGDGKKFASKGVQVMNKEFF